MNKFVYLVIVLIEFRTFDMKKINDSLDTDMLLEIWEGKSTEEIADDLWDNFGSNWCSDEFDFINRELVADGFERFIDRECDTLSDFEDICEYADANDLFQHLSLDEKESMLEYYGYEDEEEEEEEEEDEEDEEIFRNDSFDIHTTTDSSDTTLVIYARNPIKFLAVLSIDDLKSDWTKENSLLEIYSSLQNLKGKLDKDAAEALASYLNNYLDVELGFKLQDEIDNFKADAELQENYDNDVDSYLDDKFLLDMRMLYPEFYYKK